MSRPFPSEAFRGGDMSEALFDAVEQLRSTFDRKVATRMGRGDVRAAVLALLSEEPMHGYQIIHEIEARSGGAWKPSAGSVYPTLQMLADEGVISATESHGRKTYSLTGEATAEAEAAAAAPPWQAGTSHAGGTRAALPKAGVELAHAAAQVVRSGSPAQIEEAVAVLDDARRKLYAILAQG